MKTILFLIFSFSFCFNNAFSQKSKKAESGNSESVMNEYDYYEKLRLERKEKKVLLVKTFEYVNDALSTKDSFDVNGYLRKREIYTFDLENLMEKLYSTIFVERYDDEGNMYGYSVIPVNMNIINNFDKVKPTYFYEIGIDEETLVDDVKYIFDKNDNLIEKRSYGDYLYGTGKEYETEYFYYDKNNRLIESKYLSGKSSTSITKYFYTEKGLLDKVESEYDFQNGGRVYGIRYEYLFYDIGNN